MRLTQTYHRRLAILPALLCCAGWLLLGSGPTKSAAPAVRSAQHVHESTTQMPTSCSAVGWTHLVNATVSGTTLSKTSPPNQWDAGATSNVQTLSTDIRVYVTAGASTDEYMFGISHGDPDAGYTNINYAMHVHNNQLNAYVNGTNMGSLGTYAAGDSLEVAAIQTFSEVYFYKNGTLLRTLTDATLNFPLLMDTSLYNGQILEGQFCSGGTQVIVPDFTATSTVTPTSTATSTPTITPTSTPISVPTGCAAALLSFSGSITAGDPTHANYVGVTGPPSSCSTPKTCPGLGGDPNPYHYDSYILNNTNSSPQCITVVVDGTGCGATALQAELYQGSFDPANLCTNYLGDSGGGGVRGPTTMAVTLPANTALVIVVEEYNPNIGCAGYTVTVSRPLFCTATPTNTATNTRTATLTATAIRTAIPTSVPPTQTPGGPTATPVPPTATNTPLPTQTPGGPTATSTPCAIQFHDVTDPTAYYYTPVYYLACHGVISGYSDGTFRPFAQTTRQQMVKIIVLGFQVPIQTPAGGNYTFTDVPIGSTFFSLVETAAARGIVSGYTCGGPGKPCDGQHRTYFRPANNVTRGQLAKITVLTAGWSLISPPSASFSDVPVGSTFYSAIETAVCHSILSGYSDHSYRPTNNATRGQISKIVYNAIGSGPNCGPLATPPARP